jgi:hypothetical protein
VNEGAHTGRQFVAGDVGEGRVDAGICARRDLVGAHGAGDSIVVQFNTCVD